ncbi:MAG: minor capsid protein [Peptostreptococcaceae bacterium]|nr:minor capsid protein [Peptostreptococcaceae bacterium]
MRMKTSLVFDIKKAIKKRGLYRGSRVQKFIDSEVIRRMDPYTPMDSGTLKGAAIKDHTVIGSGVIKQKTPYARRQYYEHKGNGRRGRKWFERMKADHKDSILKGAEMIAKRGE